MDDQAEPLDLTTAELALDRGDYGQCLELLGPLADVYPLQDPNGARIRLLMVTAWMGQGNETDAITMCRLLTRSKDPELRQQAKQLLTVLESPSLVRPKRWSMQLPDLEMTATGSGTPAAQAKRRRRGPPPPPPPPTGPTRAPSLGFAALVTAVLLGLTVLLSGCVRIDAELNLPGPDRLQLSWQIQNQQGLLLPWQQQIERQFRQQFPDLSITHPTPGSQRMSSPTLPAKQLDQQLTQMIAITAAATGLPLSPPSIVLRERNWLIGVDQQFMLEMDLSDVPAIDALHIQLKLNNDHNIHSLHGGEKVVLRLHNWQWNPLGFGTLAAGSLLIISLVLQTRRRLLGYGFPELPS